MGEDARDTLTTRGIDLARLGVPADRLLARLVALDVLDAPHAPDAALAFACAEQSATALSEFERLYGREFPGALSRLSLNRAEIDEVAQIVRERLFVVRPGAPPKILDYAGRGALAAWLRAVIVRAGIDLRRSRNKDPDRPGDVDPLLDLAGAATADLELESLRARYQQPFREAFRDALLALPQDERNALRLNVAEGLNIAQIGQIYGVHRATVARWIASARDAIAANTRRLLAERLKLPAPDIESLVRLCQSRLDVGFSALSPSESQRPAS